MMTKDSFKKVKTAGLSLISGIALLLIIWLALYGKIKASELIAPLLEKLPKNEQGLAKITEKVLGEAVRRTKNGEVKKAVEKGTGVFETSEYAEPAREIRENVKQRVNEVIESVKELPSQEIKVIKKQVCKEWLEEVATESGKTSN